MLTQREQDTYKLEVEEKHNIMLEKWINEKMGERVDGGDRGSRNRGTESAQTQDIEQAQVASIATEGAVQ